MLYSKLFGKTTKIVSQDEKIPSAKLLIQAGFIKESSSGRFYLLPLGMRVQQKIIKIIKEEMDRAGAQEMVTPIFHPLDLWKETNRDKEAKYELTILRDRRNAEFVPGGTAEEMFVDLVRKYQISYKDLPFNIYQFSNKFRDELRARGGLLRVREFVMKDAYSFHADETDFKKEYQNMLDTYKKIFSRLHLKTIIVESDNGYIGGEYCHEFVVENQSGDTKYLTNEDGTYCAHEEVAKFKRYEDSKSETAQPRKDVEGKGIVGVTDLAKFLNIPENKTTKTLIYKTDKGEIIAAAVNGIYDINEVKLKHTLGCTTLKLADAETVEKVTGAKVGYAGILNLPKSVRVVMDLSLDKRSNFECGANKTNFHSININFNRDLPYPEQFYDIALAKEGYESLSCNKKLIAKKGIEVGNIFQLGYHYSNKMHNATFTAKDGSQKKYYMGCYGIGIGRTLATVVEIYNDKKGIAWPMNIAPYQVNLIGLDLHDVMIKEKILALYNLLIGQNFEILYDDRTEISAGEKFADSDLIGIPVRLIVSKRTGDKIEWKERNKAETELITNEELIDRLKKIINV